MIADDQVPSRRGLRIALEAGDLVVVGEAATGPEAVQVALAERPDLCLLDIDLPQGALAAARAITTRLPDTVVVMLTDSADASDLLAAIRAGAAGFLPKTIDAQRLPVAARTVLAGEAAVPRALVASLVYELREHDGGLQIPAEFRRRLTRREWQVLDLMWDELTTREIAIRLGISDVTVRRHVSDIVHKLDAPDRKTVSLLKRRDGALNPGADR